MEKSKEYPLESEGEMPPLPKGELGRQMEEEELEGTIEELQERILDIAEKIHNAQKESVKEDYRLVFRDVEEELREAQKKLEGLKRKEN